MNEANSFNDRYHYNYFKGPKALEDLADKEWNYYDTGSMKNSIFCLKMCQNNVEEKLRERQLYYNLYEAYYGPKSFRKFYVDEAFKYADHYFSTLSINECDINNCSKKLLKIYGLEFEINNIRNSISNLKDKLNLIINNINNTQLKINAKNIAITNKNNDISELNKLADSLITKGNEINKKTNGIINEGKNQVEEVKKNIKDKKDFVEEIKKFESQKREEIENMKNNNKTLKEKNEQLFQMLNALESRLN